MDWQNVVEQLMELERYPVRRMEAEKAANEQRVSQLVILESKLGQLKSASDNLANADLWDGRSASLSDTDTTLLSASAETGTLIGEYVISDATKATDSVLSGQADMTSNIASADTIEDLNTSTDITAGTITINGTILTIDASGSSGGAFSLSNDLATAATNIGTNVTGVTAGVENGRFYLESDSEIIVGHADDTSNFLSVMKLFSQTEKNYISHVGTDYYSKTETTATTSTTNFFRTGEYAWDGTNYYKALQDVPRESDLSTAPNSYFDTGIASGAASLAQVDTITGLAADAKVAQVDVENAKKLYAVAEGRTKIPMKDAKTRKAVRLIALDVLVAGGTLRLFYQAGHLPF